MGFKYWLGKHVIKLGALIITAKHGDIAAWPAIESNDWPAEKLDYAAGACGTMLALIIQRQTFDKEETMKLALIQINKVVNAQTYMLGLHANLEVVPPPLSKKDSSYIG